MQADRRAPRALIAAVATAALAVPGIALAQESTGGASAEDPATETTASSPRAQTAPDRRAARTARIVAAQRALRVEADGTIDRRTRRAIRRFQRRNGLKVTGRLNRPTLRQLGLGRAAARPRSAAGDSETATKAVAAVKGYIGAGYASGATGPDAFDCSGLTLTAYGDAGVKLPRTSFDQYAEGDAVEQEDIQPGDLVFFNTAGAGASHVGIAVTDSTVVSATSSGGVMEHDIDDSYWGAHYVGARRIT